MENVALWDFYAGFPKDAKRKASILCRSYNVNRLVLDREFCSSDGKFGLMGLLGRISKPNEMFCTGPRALKCCYQDFLAGF